jgi:hypothetical protein
MNTPFIKAGSFRRVLLQALADGAINTIDDLQTALDEPRRKIQDNISHAADAGLCKRLRDDVTGLPAYQISKEGRDYLAVAELRHKPASSDDAQAVPQNPAVEYIDVTKIHAPAVESKEVAIDIPETPRCGPLPPVDDRRYLIVSQIGRISGSDYIRSLDEARTVALEAGKNEGMNFEVYRVELEGFAIPPSSATWQDA